MIYFVIVLGIIFGVDWKWLLLFWVAELIDRKMDYKLSKFLFS